jgi:hypothetical protein
MLYKMLEDCTFDEKHCKIISWQPHGLAFKVHNRDELEKILPMWFREKYESWRCLLEQWGFLKLTRGNDRGCWYHKKFCHHTSSIRSKRSYENVEKEVFIDAMPEYLSFRDEPDLERESTLDNRISPKKRKRTLNLLLEKDTKVEKVPMFNNNNNTNEKTKNEKTSLSGYRQKRYGLSTLKECRYCHELFASQGFTKHEEACPKRNSMNDSDTGSDSDDDSERNTLSETDDDEEERGNNIMVARNEDEKSLKGSDNKSAQRRSVLSDDSSVDSVDSIESGCRICGFDDDHANLLLCEGCDKEVHTYCLNPPLEKVPTGDWFCGKEHSFDCLSKV